MVPVSELEAIKARIQDELLAMSGVTGLEIGEQVDIPEHQSLCLIIRLNFEPNFMRGMSTLIDLLYSFLPDHSVPLDLVAIKMDPCPSKA